MKLNSLRTVFGAALLGAVFSAQALTLNLTGFAQGSQNVTVGAANTGANISAAAGAFKGSLLDAGSFTTNNFFTYCVELTQSFQFGSPAKTGSGGATTYVIVDGLSYFNSNFAPALAAGPSTVIDRLGKLFTALSGVNDPVNTQKSVAIQLAVWESIYEHQASNPFLLSSGNFTATGNIAGTITEASGYLSAAKALNHSIYSISVLRSADAQDFLLVQRVPEPASLALAGLALAGLAYTRRRRA